MAYNFIYWGGKLELDKLAEYILSKSTVEKIDKYVMCGDFEYEEEEGNPLRHATGILKNGTEYLQVTGQTRKLRYKRGAFCISQMPPEEDCIYLDTLYEREDPKVAKQKRIKECKELLESNAWIEMVEDMDYFRICYDLYISGQLEWFMKQPFFTIDFMDRMVAYTKTAKKRKK